MADVQKTHWLSRKGGMAPEFEHKLFFAEKIHY